MCGIVVKMLSDQGYSEEQMDRLSLVEIGYFDGMPELPDNLVKYRDYVIKHTMDRYQRARDRAGESR
jgi:hypothetical protein